MVDRPCCCPGRSLLGQFATDNFPPKFRSRTNFPKICVNGRRAEAVTGRAEAATGRAQAVTGDRKHFFYSTLPREFTFYNKDLSKLPF